jgi:hypothetical protein
MVLSMKFLNKEVLLCPLNYVSKHFYANTRVVLITELYYKIVITKIIYELAILNKILLTSWCTIF